jgi:uncharacterized phage protein (TIGR02220 family)
MSKDPAFLFYSQDFLVGTMAMPFDDRGRYITLLCFMHQNGHITEQTATMLIGPFSEILKAKFKVDENGLFYNERLDLEVQKRTKFVESRQINGKNGGRPPKTQVVKVNNLTETDRLSVGKPKNNLIENENVIGNTVDYLNQIVSSSFKKTTISTKKFIEARINEGYGLEDFKKVIDIKSEKWLNDAAMSQYLRPETLFGNKFESYLNEAKKNNKVIGLKAVH